MMTVRSVAMLAATLLVAAATPAAAENVLRFTGKDAWAATMDPDAYSSEDNKVATYQVYEALLDVDSNLAVVPQLALALGRPPARPLTGPAVDQALGSIPPRSDGASDETSVR